MSPEQREDAKEVVSGNLFKLAQERWPNANIRALSLHCDTSNLHFDIWATELEKTTVTIRNKPVDKYVTKGQCFNSGLCGPGTMFLQAKKDLGHKLHPVDEAKLKRSLDMYQTHRMLTKKTLPEIPEEITFYRNLDKKLTGIFKDQGYPKRLKEEYLGFCKMLDSHKYFQFDKLSSLRELETKIIKREDELSERIEACIDKTAKAEELHAEAEKLKTEAEDLLAKASVATKPERAVLIKLWKSPSIRPHLLRNFPKTMMGLAKNPTFNRDPDALQMCAEILVALDKDMDK